MVIFAVVLLYPFTYTNGNWISQHSTKEQKWNHWWSEKTEQAHRCGAVTTNHCRDERFGHIWKDERKHLNMFAQLLMRIKQPGRETMPIPTVKKHQYLSNDTRTMMRVLELGENTLRTNYISSFFCRRMMKIF